MCRNARFFLQGSFGSKSINPINLGAFRGTQTSTNIQLGHVGFAVNLEYHQAHQLAQLANVLVEQNSDVARTSIRVEDESKYRSCGRNRIISCSKHLYPLNPCNVFAQGTNILPLGLIICRFSSGLEIFDTWAC